MPLTAAQHKAIARSRIALLGADLCRKPTIALRNAFALLRAPAEPGLAIGELTTTGTPTLDEQRNFLVDDRVSRSEGISVSRL